MATTEEPLTRPGAGEQFEPSMSDEFASRAIARDERLEAFIPGITLTQLAVVLLLAGVYLATSFFALHHTDLWAHLAFGREMVESGKLLEAEPFGVETGEQPFVNVAWLAQVIDYAVYSSVGPEGLRLLHALMATAAILFVLLATRARRVSWPWAIAAGATTYFLSLTSIGVIRPQLAGVAALPLVLLAVARVGRTRAPLIWLPPVFLLWANLHGSFVIGLFVMLVALADELLSARRKLGSSKAALATESNRRFALLTALCLVATLINPLGPVLWFAVAGFSSQANLVDIVEWRPLVIKSFGGAMFFTTLFITAILLRVSPRRIRWSEAVLLFVFALAALLSMRMLAWWAIVWPWVVAPHAMAAIRARFGRMANAPPEARPLRTLIAVAMIFLALVWAPGSHALLAARPMSDAAAANDATPVLMAEELANRELEGKVFAPMEWADYLVWKTEGRLEPMVYSHVHLIAPETWEQYRQIRTGSAAWLRHAEAAELRFLVLPRREPTARFISSHPRTVIRYQDQQSIVVELLAEEAE